ncbi:MAG TPA: DNA modification methylase [Verrucomicrobiota bacterium]|nr:DNA modification methylase [Verrucomicrobiota bacterium]
MATSTKYPPAHGADEVLVRLREDYEQAVLDLFESDPDAQEVRPALRIVGHTSNFLDNLRLPVHRWFRYSAGFSAEWVKWLLAERKGSELRVLDPFVGSGTTCLASDEMGVVSYGLEAHPFVHRVADAKLSYTADPGRFLAKADSAFRFARTARAADGHPDLIRRCFSPETLDYLDRFRQAVENEQDGTREAQLLWMALVSSLRVASEAGTAPWQYVLPGRRKTAPPSPESALHKAVQMIATDIRFMARRAKPLAKLRWDDARNCATVPDAWTTFVITSPPYANNYDYADATRLEMAFMGEIRGWGDLQETVRRHLVRACSQHVPPSSVNLEEVLEAPELAPVRDEIVPVCRELSEVRLERGGKKTYNNMVACYFLDMAQVWRALRRVCASPSEVCFVIGDSAPYGVYVPVIAWFGKLALAAGFDSWTFDKLRDRNTKWKNRKHRVPLCEGHLWVRG